MGTVLGQSTTYRGSVWLKLVSPNMQPLKLYLSQLNPPDGYEYRNVAAAPIIPVDGWMRVEALITTTADARPTDALRLTIFSTPPLMLGDCFLVDDASLGPDR